VVGFEQRFERCPARWLVRFPVLSRVYFCLDELPVGSAQAGYSDLRTIMDFSQWRRMWNLS